MRNKLALGAALVALVVSLAANVTVFIVDDHRKANDTQAIRAICAFRLNIVKGIRGSEEYLRQIRLGERPPIVGLTEADLQLSLKRQRATLESLDNSGLRCS
jgi:hypothetical protein